MSKHLQLLLFLVLSVKSAFSANILYVADIGSPSHHIWNRALAMGLVEKGHNVTHIGPDQDKHPNPKNYNHILIEGIYDALDENFDINEMANSGPLQLMEEFKYWCVAQCNITLHSKGLQTLLNYPKDFKFDLIIFDVTGGVCLYPLIKRFNYPPTMGVTAFLLPNYVSYAFGNSLYPSYVPWYALPYTTEMSFLERVWNTLYTYGDIAYKYKFHYNDQYQFAKTVFEDLPPVEEFERHISLVLANTDPIMDHPQPIPPNIIPVGGLHTRKSQKLPQDLQNIVDNAKHGVILFSLGTNVRSDKLDKNTQKALLEAFKQVPQTVIWKFESEIENLPKNVIVRKWLPQNDILGHPNVKVFIGHGGALSTQEAFFHGVPMIVIPFVVDQYINAKIIVNKGSGVQVDFNKITTEYFLKQLREVLENPKYSNNMKQFSSMFRDRSETPLERGVFWTEYVLRHKGAHFLSPPARNLPFYVTTGLDVLAFLISVIAIAIVSVCKLLKLISKSICKNKKIKTN